MTSQKLKLPELQEITLFANPVCRKAHYRSHLIFDNFSLQFIDEKRVTEEEREKAEVLKVV